MFPTNIFWSEDVSDDDHQSHTLLELSTFLCIHQNQIPTVLRETQVYVCVCVCVFDNCFGITELSSNNHLSETYQTTITIKLNVLHIVHLNLNPPLPLTLWRFVSFLDLQIWAALTVSAPVQLFPALLSSQQHTDTVNNELADIMEFLSATEPDIFH